MITVGILFMSQPTLSMDMEIAPKKQKIDGEFSFNLDYPSSGYAGNTIRRLAQDFLSTPIASSTECVIIKGTIHNVAFTSEDMETCHQHVIDHYPDVIEQYKVNGVSMQNIIIEQLSKKIIPFAYAIPVSKLIRLEQHEIITINGKNFIFKGTPEQLYKLRKPFKKTPVVFCINRKEIDQLIKSNIIFRNHKTRTFCHGLCGNKEHLDSNQDQ